MSKALIVVDVQRDFVEGGSLAVEGGLEVAKKVSALINGGDHWDMGMGDARQYYKRIVATKDWHDRNGTNGEHFAEDPDYVDTWPAHCIANSTGSEFAGSLGGLMFDDIFHKGWGKPAYSGFEGISVRNATTSLHGYLQTYGLFELDLCGIAADVCLKATALDGLDKGYVVRVLSDLTVAVGDKDMALKELEAAGAVII